MSGPVKKRVVVFGEVLFDCFPDGTRVLGGAPFNVAWHLQGFGFEPLMVSRVGDDAPGREVLERMAGWGMETAGVEVDGGHPTGQVQVRMSGGQPSYEIVADQAYDHIEGRGLAGVDGAMVYHGTLAARSPVSRATLHRLRAQVEAPVFFDINLRPPWWSVEGLVEWLGAGTWLKLNGDELRDLDASLGLEGRDLCDSARRLTGAHALAGIVLTHGADGAELIAAGADSRRAPAAPLDNLVDTVGAGDAFSSVGIAGLLLGWPAEKLLARAGAFAAAVCARRGALIAERPVYKTLLDKWRCEDE